MKKVMSLIAMLAVGSMLAGCYSKACEEPVAAAPYKDSAAVMPAPAAQEEAKPAHHKKHHKVKHHAKHHNTMKKMEEKADAAMPAANEPAANPQQ